MIRTLLILLLFYSQFVSGQVDASKIKTISKEFNRYEFSEEQDDSSSSLPLMTESFEATYPEIKTPDPLLNKFINDTIQKIIGIYRSKGVSKRIIHDYTSILDKPSEIDINFSANFISPQYISVTIRRDWEAGGGANGSSHYRIPLSFDLVNKKIVSFLDILEEKEYQMAYDILFEKFKGYTKDEMQLELYRNHQYLNNMLDSWVAIFVDEVIIFRNVSYGGKSADEEISLDFKTHSNLFKKGFLKRIKAKN